MADFSTANRRLLSFHALLVDAAGPPSSSSEPPDRGEILLVSLGPLRREDVTNAQSGVGLGKGRTPMPSSRADHSPCLRRVIVQLVRRHVVLRQIRHTTSPELFRVTAKVYGVDECQCLGRDVDYIGIDIENQIQDLLDDDSRGEVSAELLVKVELSQPLQLPISRPAAIFAATWRILEAHIGTSVYRATLRA